MHDKTHTTEGEWIDAGTFEYRVTRRSADPSKETTRTHDRDNVETFVNSIGMRLVKLRAGEYLMGAPDSEPALEWSKLFEFQPGSDEKPAHKVRITQNFGIGMYPVTLGQFKKFVEKEKYKTTGEINGEGCMGINLASGHVFLDQGFTWKTPWRTPGTNIHQTGHHPVVCVSWDDATKFCEWLSKEENRTYRLPYEGEWEYACRAGAKTPYFFGNREADLEKYANVADASLQRVWIVKMPGKDMPPVGTHLPPYAQKWDDRWPFTAPVGSFRPNRWGLYDMAGNVGEWCQDWYSPTYYTDQPIDDPKGPADGDEIDLSIVPGLPPGFPPAKKLRVVRGGVWLDPAVAYRSSERRTHVRHPVVAGADIGFRVVLEDPDACPWKVESV